jgi:hypothetical protein
MFVAVVVNCPEAFLHIDLMMAVITTECFGKALTA